MSTYPVHFHVGMVSDLKGAVSGDVDMSEDKAIEKAEEVLWRARLESFQAHFEKDLVTLKRAIHGHGLLQDKLAWMAHMKRNVQVGIAQKLVETYTGWFFPEVVSDWNSLVCDIQNRMGTPLPTLPPPATASAFAVDPLAQTYALARLDLNTPLARNALVIDRYGPLLSTLARVHGANQFVVVVVLASRPKEDSTGDVLEDEVLITRKLAQHGFLSNMKVMQELQPHAEMADFNYLQRDTFITYKLFWMSESLKQAFTENRWCRSAAVLSGKVQGRVSLITLKS